jgi:hypothetical protein
MAFGTNEKYVKQTYEALSNNNLNLENVAVQIAQLPVREQKRFFRLLLNYTDIASTRKINPAMREITELSERIMDLVNNYYVEQDQLAFEGM